MLEVLNHLKNELPFYDEFFLHGSRGKKTLLGDSPDITHSDWDFAVQHKQPWQDFDQRLVSKGWVGCVGKSYLDNDTAFVYEKTINSNKVQISCRQNLKRYKDVWNSVSPDFYFRYLWKGAPNCLPVEDRRELYNSLYYVWDCGRLLENTIS